MNEVARLVDALTGKDHNAGYAALKELLAESSRSNAVCAYFDRFAGMMRSESSYERIRGISLIAANAKWAAASDMERVIEALLTHILDEKPTVARQCIQALPQIAAARPELAERIRQALQNADTRRYNDSMEPLIRRDIADTLAQIGGASQGL